MSGVAPSGKIDFSRLLLPGDHVIWPQGTGEPTGLSTALLQQSPQLPRPTLVLGMVTTQTLDLAAEANVDFLCLNGAANSRRAAALSQNRVVPAHVSAIPGLIMTRRIPVQVALVRARPTDDPDVLSLGVMVDYVHEMIAVARVVVAELDDRLPLTGDDALIPRSRIAHFTRADGAEPILADAVPSQVDKTIAEHVADLIPNGATVQVGVGAVPSAVCAALSRHQDLGLHSGVISDAAVSLIEAGVVNNRYKSIDRGRTVTGGLFGSHRLFQFVHNNEVISLRRATYTHAARTLSQIDNFYTINSAVEIDLSGQCNSEVAGRAYVGAVGGQVDYVRGGRLSLGGRSIIALASVTPDGKHSKIVSGLASRPVTTPRSDVDLVVTEFGVADLWGLDLLARSKALIQIAHPHFQEELAREFHRIINPGN